MQIEVWFAGYARIVRSSPYWPVRHGSARVPVRLSARVLHRHLARHLRDRQPGAGIRRPVRDLRGRLRLRAVLARSERTRTASLGAAVLIPFAITAFVTDDGDAFHWGDIVFAALIIGGPWAAGLAIRLRRESERSLTLRTVELERDQDERARAAVAEERARIARELHDVVAHAISVVVVQARGGRKVLDRDPEASRTAFDRSSAPASRRSARCDGCSGCCGTTTRRSRAAPQPSLERLEALADEMRGPVFRSSSRSRVSERDPAWGRRLRLPDRAGGADQRAQARRPGGRAGRRPLHAGRGRDRRSSTTAAAVAPGRGRATACSDAGAGRRLRRGIDAGPQPTAGSRVHAGCLPGRRVIRVLLADDQALVRAGFRLILSRRARHRGRRRGGRRRRGGEARGRAAAGRRADGRPHAGHRRDRGDRRIVVDEPSPRVLVLTTFDLDENVYQALRAGASGFLLKDAPEERLLAAIRIVAAAGRCSHRPSPAA